MKKLTLKLIVILLGIAGFAGESNAQTVYGLLSGGTSFVTFDVATPGSLSAPISITGLDSQKEESIQAIDFRPSDGNLYGYSTVNRVFTILSNGAATLFSDLGSLTPVSAAPNTVGTGSDFASTFPPTGQVSIDVNPTANSNLGALRIVDNARQNFRFVFDAPAATALNLDDTVTYQIPPQTRGLPVVIGAAYTNNDVDPATPTSLYVLDETTNSIYLQNPPNDGLLTNGFALSIDLPTGDVGFDVPLFGSDIAYISANDMFYSLQIGVALPSLLTIGQIGDVEDPNVIDIAIIPEPATNFLLLGGLGAVLLAGNRIRSRSPRSL